MIRAIQKLPPSPQRLLIVLPNWLGDTAMATPALRTLRRKFPQAHIAYLGRPGPLNLLAGAPWADDFIQAEVKSKKSGIVNDANDWAKETMGNAK